MKEQGEVYFRIKGMDGLGHSPDIREDVVV